MSLPYVIYLVEREQDNFDQFLLASGFKWQLVFFLRD